jgi:uncharacterized membrane protein
VIPKKASQKWACTDITFSWLGLGTRYGAKWWKAAGSVVWITIAAHVMVVDITWNIADKCRTIFAPIKRLLFWAVIAMAGLSLGTQRRRARKRVANIKAKRTRTFDVVLVKSAVIVAKNSISIDTSIPIVNITSDIFQWLLFGANRLAKEVGI